MVKPWWLAGLAVTALAYGACSKDEAGADGGAGKTAAAGTGGIGSGGTSKGGTGSGGVAGKGGAGGAAAGPAITSAPPAWMRPADCGGIGNLCPNLSGCAEKSTCQLEGNVCIPKFPDGATSLPGRTAETPYCAAYTCMTFEDASCFCTGDAGRTIPGCSSPSALAGLCVAEKASCADKPCCDGLTCTENAGGYPVCQIPCTQGSDCASGCCTDVYDTGVQICAAADACTNPCKKRGDATCNPGSATMANDCCRGSCVQSDNPDYAGCRQDCNVDADCDTGCCRPFANSTSGFCTDARYCMCGVVGAPCGERQAACCEGMSCASFGDAPFTCHPLCDATRPCVTGSCETFSDGSGSVCYTAGAGGAGGAGGSGGGGFGGAGGSGVACGGVLEACAPGQRECCGGLSCLGEAGETGTCYQTCADPSACTTECIYLEEAPDGICVPEGAM